MRLCTYETRLRGLGRGAAWGGSRGNVKRPRRDARALHGREGGLTGPQVVQVRDQRGPAILEQQDVLRRDTPQLPFDLPNQGLGTAESPVAMGEKNPLFGPPL